jgi:two-component system nitrate/nitrite response regulator NarL
LSKEGLVQVLKAYQFRTVVGPETLNAVTSMIWSKARLVIITDPSAEPDLAKALGSLRAENPALRFVLLVDVNDPAKVESALQAPAHAFLSHKMGCDALIKVLEVVLADGAVFFSIELMTHLLSRVHNGAEHAAPAPPSVPPLSASGRPLSDREVDILCCLTDGASNKLIARRFGIAESTVKIHVKGILRKINVQNRTQAAIWALAHLPSVESSPNDGSEAEPRTPISTWRRSAAAGGLRHRRSSAPSITSEIIASRI